MRQAIFCCGCGHDVQARLTEGVEVYPHRPDLVPSPAKGDDVVNDLDAFAERMGREWGYFQELKSIVRRLRKSLTAPSPERDDLALALSAFAEIAQKAKPNCGPKLRALIQEAQEKYSEITADALKKMGG